MRAIRLYEFGPAGNLRHEHVDDPVPGPGQVRVAVAAAGVHLIDTSIREGDAPPGQSPDLPTVLGRDAAGVVDALGPGTDPAWLGRRVVVYLGARSGGYAELVVADAAALHPLPDEVTFEAAVALIGTGRTTVAVLEVAAITAGDTVLVTSAAGGMGVLAVQAAKRAGATVIGVAGGPAKAQIVRDHGADLAVDYLRPAWREEIETALGPRPATVALDGVGGDIGRAALELLGVGGRLVLFGYSSGTATRLDASDLFMRGISATAAIGPRILDRPGGLRALETQALTSGLVPLVQTFPLAEAVKAHTALQARETSGKVVLLP